MVEQLHLVLEWIKASAGIERFWGSPVLLVHLVLTLLS